MFLQFRPALQADLKSCVALIRNGFAFPDDADRADLVALWKELLGDGRMIGAVIEDSHAANERRIAWLCFKVFVTNDYAAYLKSETAAPLSSRHLLELHRANQGLPLLSLADIRRANSDGAGLNMLVTHYGSPYPIRPDCAEWNEVASHLLAFTAYFSGGYNTQELFEEFYDSYNAELAQNAGFFPCNDFHCHYREGGLPSDGERPFLMSVTGEGAAQRPGTIAAAVFQYQKPQLFFAPAEQELLMHSLLGETDEEIASRLSLAHVTVRKRWGAIYERVADAVPDFFGDSFMAEKLDSPNHAVTRGPEKKRRLLAYLHRHLEELRPLEARPA